MNPKKILKVHNFQKNGFTIKKSFYSNDNIHFCNISDSNSMIFGVCHNFKSNKSRRYIRTYKMRLNGINIMFNY